MVGDEEKARHTSKGEKEREREEGCKRDGLMKVDKKNNFRCTNSDIGKRVYPKNKKQILELMRREIGKREIERWGEWGGGGVQG